MGKEIRSGSQHYTMKGLKMVCGFIPASTKRNYERKAKRKGWSLVQLVSSVLVKNAPK